MFEVTVYFILGDMNGNVKDELMDIDDLLDDAEEDQKPISVLQGLANEVAETLKKEKDEVKKEDVKTTSKNKENRKEGGSSSKDQDATKTRTPEEEERRRREKEERRRREKEKEREKRKKEEREKKRESRPYKETEMRNDLDSGERAKIKLMAQRLKEESQAKKLGQETNKPSTAISSLPKIPKVPRKEGEEKKSGTEKKGEEKKSLLPPPSFEDLLGAMDGKAKVAVKAPHIKNKNRDLLASFSSSPPSASQAKPLKSRQEVVTKLAEKSGKPTVSDFVKDMIKPMRTEDKSLKIIPAAALERIEEEEKKEKKAEKRPSTEELEPTAPKIKVKSTLQLKESPLFGDFLSTIMKDDQPKKKKIKIAELKAKNKEEEEKERLEREKAVDNGTEVAVGTGFSFYRDTMDEINEVADGAATVPLENGPSSPISETAGVASPTRDSSPRSADGMDDNNDDNLPFAEPSNNLPREVRGILVYARGAGKKKRRINWPDSDADLVQVEYFELDETERVNVNKLKFEEIRKREHMLEKNSMGAAKSGVTGSTAEDDSRAWPGLLNCDFEVPSIEYGGNSVEKTAQKQRENSVLQALIFNNRLPNDPSEPETGGFPKGIVIKHIPLEDESGEDATIDYSGEDWPLPTPDEFSRQSSPGMAVAMRGGPQAADAIYASIQQNLQNMMGFAGGEDEVSAGMNIAMYAAQKAAEEALRQQGLLPPLATPTSMGNMSAGPQFMFGGAESAGRGAMLPNNEEAFDPMNEPYEPMDMDYGSGPAAGGGMPEMMPGMPMQGPGMVPLSNGLLPEPGMFQSQMTGAGGWRGGGGPRFSQHHRGGGGRDFRGGPSGRDFRGGHFHPRGSSSNNFSDRYNSDRKSLGRGRGGDRDDRGGGRSDFRDGFPPRRPCRFWAEKGFCREKDHCKFAHLPSPR